MFCNCRGQFKISKDTEVIENDLQGQFSGIGAVVRYITLYDTQARGFVRPLCIAYLTWDRIKISHSLGVIRNKLRRVSEPIGVKSIFVFIKT